MKGVIILSSTFFTILSLLIVYILENPSHAHIHKTLRLWWRRLYFDAKERKEEPLSSKHLPNEKTTDKAYGVDVSFPMQRSLGNNRQQFYDTFIQGCRDYWEDQGHLCDNVDQERMNQNRLQPQYMVNFTETGYKKMRAPEALYNLLRQFWEKNRERETKEYWFAGNIFTNYWVSPSQMISIHNTENEDGGHELATAVSDATKEIIEEWTGMNLTSTSVYGIRVYKRGAVLVPHVDRLPLISSAIINVAQDVDEPWPLEVIGHDGIARNITMEPGDLVLYESHSILHGRPFSLAGNYFANVFIHFKPMQPQDTESRIPIYVSNNTDAIEWYKNEMGIYDDRTEDYEESVADSDDDGHNKNEDNLFHRLGEDEDSGDRAYDDIDQLDESYEYQTYEPNSDDQHEAHLAAGDGDLGYLQRIIRENSDSIHYVDRNGWTPAHEAARGLHLEILSFLLENGADMNAITAIGYSVLDVAINSGGENHPAVLFLRKMMAKADEETNYISRNMDTFDTANTEADTQGKIVSFEYLREADPATTAELGVDEQYAVEDEAALSNDEAHEAIVTDSVDGSHDEL